MTVTTVFETKTKSTLNAAVRTSDVITYPLATVGFLFGRFVCVCLFFFFVLYTFFSRPLFFFLHSCFSITLCFMSVVYAMLFSFISPLLLSSSYAFYYHELFVEQTKKNNDDEE